MAASPSDRRLSVIPSADMRRLFTIVARPRHSWQQQINPQIATEDLAESLIARGVHCTVSYSMPSYVVDPVNANAQHEILLMSPFHTQHFIFDFVPWCREDEAAELPWITGSPDDDLTITLNPLGILPTPISRNRYCGTIKLKDNFVAAMGQDYDVKTPDFSYLMVADLKQYYLSKHNCIVLCKNIVVNMASLLQQFVGDLQKATQAAQIMPNNDEVQKAQIKGGHINVVNQCIKDCVAHLATQVAEIPHIIYPVNHIYDAPISLEKFRSIPALSEMPVPPGYAARLKKIHRVATNRVYGVEANVEAAAAINGGFKPYLSVGHATYEYTGLSAKTAATAEALGTFASLKYIANVFGFKIIDLNYSILEQVVSAVHRNNVNINLLQFCVNTLIAYTQTVYDTLTELSKKKTPDDTTTGRSRKINILIEHLWSITQQHYNTATACFHQFMHLKEQYLTTYLHNSYGTQTPTSWIQVDNMPLNSGEDGSSRNDE